MFLFLRLLLAHFIGDFPLQLNRVYELKHSGFKGGIPHAFIISLCLLFFSWPYLHIPGVWGFALLVATLHLFQDSAKIIFGNIKYSFWLYILDQLFHVATIALLFLTPLRNLAPPTQPQGILISLYNNNSVIIYLCALIIATYNGMYLSWSFKSTFCPHAGITTKIEKWYGMLERAVIVTLFFLGSRFLLLLVPLAALRWLVFLFDKKSRFVGRCFVSRREFLLSWTIAGLTGVALFLILPLYR
jgi:hypothetical protein